jgi:hypothetical protein
VKIIEVTAENKGNLLVHDAKNPDRSTAFAISRLADAGVLRRSRSGSSARSTVRLTTTKPAGRSPLRRRPGRLVPPPSPNSSPAATPGPWPDRRRGVRPHRRWLTVVRVTPRRERPPATAGRSVARSAPADARERLLLGLQQSIEQKGYRETTLTDVVRIAGASRRTFYLVFDTKTMSCSP